jgi:anti-repressor protein
MNNDMMLFENEEFGKVRVVEVDDEHYFSLKDVLEAQGSKTTTTNAITSIESGLGHGYVVGIPITDRLGRDQDAKFISESAVTFLVARSNTERGRKCNRWIHTEILPSIRKHGAYMTPEKLHEVMSDPRHLAQLLTTLADEQDKNKLLAETLIVQSDKIEQDAPKVLMADTLIGSEETILIGTLAKLLNNKGVKIGRNRLFEQLRADGFLSKQRGESWNIPTQKALNMGLFEVKENVIDNKGGITITFTTKVTGKGQLFFINYFAKKVKEEQEQDTTPWHKFFVQSSGVN